MGKRLALLLWTLPVWAQYAGPAILSRGEAPTSASTADIRFRPFVEVHGMYDSGLAGVAVSDNGTLANQSSYGMGVSWGISGTHNWTHTKIGLDYRGDYNHYLENTQYDSTDQSLMLGITHQFSRHVVLTLRETAGMFSRNFNVVGLRETVPFDPLNSYIPMTDFFDNRTVYLTTQADLTYRRSARLSFNFGGDGFVNRRRSTALYGVVGGTARADVQYRISRRSTIGAAYVYNYFGYTKIFGGTNAHTAGLTFSTALSRRTEFSIMVGSVRAESQFIQTVPIDPAIAALLGISEGTQIAYSVRWAPAVQARISHIDRKGMAWGSAGRAITPGNGLFLTSLSTMVTGGYSYMGLRHWSFNGSVAWVDSESLGNITGNYRNLSGTVSMTRQLMRYIHFVASYSARQYSSSDYSGYNRFINEAQVGLGFAPRELPLTIR